jgi:hypothetical protein
MIELGGQFLDPSIEAHQYILDLAAEYEVSDKFLGEIVPNIKEIFAFDISPDQRDSLLTVAEKSFKLQMETEAILKGTSALIGYLGPHSYKTGRSRRQTQVSYRATRTTTTKVASRQVRRAG